MLRRWFGVSSCGADGAGPAESGAARPPGVGGAARAGASLACGFAALRAHLPFGDPAAPPGAAGFARPLRRMLGRSLLAARRR